MVAACPFPAPRGTPVRIRRIAEALARRGHAVHVFTYPVGRTVPLPGITLHRTARVPFYIKESAGPSAAKLLALDPLLAMKLRRLVRKLAIDVIHAHHAEGMLCSLPARHATGVPLVYDVHTLLGAELPYFAPAPFKGTFARIGRRLDISLPAAADRVIAVSDQIRAALLADGRLTDSHVQMIPNGVEEELLAAKPVAPGHGDLVYAGNLAPFQGISHLLKALPSMLRARPALRLRLLTDERFDAYEAEAVALGVRDRITIEHVPFTELPRRLASAAVAINPRTECTGIPQKLMNYMAAACPIVSFAGSAKHVEHGASALVVPDGDVEGMAAATLRLLDDTALARRLGECARQQARAHFTWDRMAERIEGVYHEVLAGRATVDA